MATDNQIEANRQNAQHCTGPKTEEGKARSSQNALKTGLYSQKEVLATESREDYEALATEYHDHFAPANPYERSLVDALVRYEWLSRRYMAADTALWNFSLVDNQTPQGKAFMYHAENLSRAGRYFNQVRKGYASTMKELEAARSRRQAEEAKRLATEPERVPNQSELLSEPRPQGSGNETPKPTQNQSLTSKLVSFRQPPRDAEPDPSQPHQQPEDSPHAA